MREKLKVVLATVWETRTPAGRKGYGDEKQREFIVTGRIGAQ